jgi:Skp family chaperone for outer membrane proteins
MKKALSLAILTLALAFTASAQADDDEPVCVSRTTAQRCMQAFNEVQASRQAIEALKAELQAQKNLNAINEKIIEAKDAIIADQQKLVEILKKQSRRKVSIAFGLIKIYY